MDAGFGSSSGARNVAASGDYVAVTRFKYVGPGAGHYNVQELPGEGLVDEVCWQRCVGLIAGLSCLLICLAAFWLLTPEGRASTGVSAAVSATASPELLAPTPAGRTSYIVGDDLATVVDAAVQGEVSDPYRRYMVRLDHSTGERLGLRLQSEFNSLFVSSTSDGLVGTWNEGHPELAIRPGDRIVAANGVYGDSAAMLQECDKFQHLDLTMLRVTRGPLSQPKPLEFYEIFLDRTNGDEFGAYYLPARTSLLIRGINGGLFAQWNSRNPKTRVQPGDRIVAVNGVQNDADLLLAECNKFQVLDMELVRGTGEVRTQFGDPTQDNPWGVEFKDVEPGSPLAGKDEDSSTATVTTTARHDAKPRTTTTPKRTRTATVTRHATASPTKRASTTAKHVTTVRPHRPTSRGPDDGIACPDSGKKRSDESTSSTTRSWPSTTTTTTSTRSTTTTSSTTRTMTHTTTSTTETTTEIHTTHTGDLKVLEPVDVDSDKHHRSKPDYVLGLKAEYWYLKPDPNWNNDTITKRALLNVTEREPSMIRIEPMVYHPLTRTGWPGVAVSEFFVAQWTGQLHIERSGPYLFKLVSDDGSGLWIDGKVVLGEGHPDFDEHDINKEQPSHLEIMESGYHNIRVLFFNTILDAAIQLEYMGLDTHDVLTLVPAEAFRVAAADLPEELLASAEYMVEKKFDEQGPVASSRSLLRITLWSIGTLAASAATSASAMAAWTFWRRRQRRRQSATLRRIFHNDEDLSREALAPRTSGQTPHLVEI